MSLVNDRGYLAYQYSDAEKYLIRVETHRDYSEASGEFSEWALDRLAPEAGALLLDVGCGPGLYHPGLARRGVPIIGMDLFAGMLETARAVGAATDLARASAEVLPFRDHSFKYVMANHMLYHVEGQRSALSEMRRVLRGGGRAMFTTSGANNMQELFDLHAEACASVGLNSTPREQVSRFALEDVELVAEVFADVATHHRPDALLFTETEPLLRFYASFAIDYVSPLPADGEHRAALLQAMRALAERQLARNGRIRIQKDAGCFIATTA